MKDVLQAIVGFLFLATILLIFFNNCSFTVECGGERPETFREYYSGKGCYQNEVY